MTVMFEYISVVGNVTGAYILGNGSQLTGVTATSSWANSLIGNSSGAGRSQLLVILHC